MQNVYHNYAIGYVARISIPDLTVQVVACSSLWQSVDSIVTKRLTVASSSGIIHCPTKVANDKDTKEDFMPYTELKTTCRLRLTAPSCIFVFAGTKKCVSAPGFLSARARVVLLSFQEVWKKFSHIDEGNEYAPCFTKRKGKENQV